MNTGLFPSQPALTKKDRDASRPGQAGSRTVRTPQAVRLLNTLEHFLATRRFNRVAGTVSCTVYIYFYLSILHLLLLFPPEVLWHLFYLTVELI